VRIAFFGDTSHPNAAGWVRDLVELHDLEIHAIDYGPPRLAHPRVREHRLSLSVPSKLRYLGSGVALGRIPRGLGGASSQLLDQVRDGMQARLSANTRVLVEVLERVPGGRDRQVAVGHIEFPLHEKLVLQWSLYSGVVD